jgi:hypothetical protein
MQVNNKINIKYNFNDVDLNKPLKFDTIDEQKEYQSTLETLQVFYPETAKLYVALIDTKNPLHEQAKKCYNTCSKIIQDPSHPLFKHFVRAQLLDLLEPHYDELSKTLGIFYMLKINEDVFKRVFLTGEPHPDHPSAVEEASTLFKKFSRKILI